MNSPGYLFDNAAPQAGQRFSSLETLFDPVTFRNLEATGIRPGWRCLEVGAGGGSVARWIAERAGPDGHVLATDLNPGWLAPADLPTVEIRRHDITRDPLPQAHFDLIHARLVLVHLPDRDAVLRRLVAALRPGGWLALEDFDLKLIPDITPGGTADEKLMNKVWDALVALLVSRGVDPCYGRKLPWLLDDAGLSGVQAEGHIAFARGGSAGARLQQANADQTRGELAASGLVTEDEISRFHDLLDDPSVTLMKPVLMYARGRRP